MTGDADPAISPAGDRLAFVRVITVYSSRVMWMPLGPGYQPAGPPREIRTPEIITASPLWTNEAHLLFSAGAAGRMWLYSATPSSGAPPTNLHVLTNGGLTFHRRTGRLVYTSGQFIQNLYRIPAKGVGGSAPVPERLTSTSGMDLMPRFSPAGNTLAFASLRFGVSGIWTIETQSTLSSELISSRFATLVPSDWSPDGRSLLYFGTTPEGRWQIYRVAVDTGKITRLLTEVADDIFPTWSRDGASISFSSSRNQESLQLFRMPAVGGPATLVAAQGVVAAQESPDGRWIYFADWPSGALYRMPRGGGAVTRVIEHICQATGYVVAKEGIYYWAGSKSDPELRFLDVESRRDSLMFRPSIPAAAYLTVSADGQWLCFPLVERYSQELMMLENWR
jgi:Tol biopolymer transport system component